MKKTVGIAIVVVGSIALTVCGQNDTKAVPGQKMSGQTGASVAQKEKFSVTQVGYGKTKPIVEKSDPPGALGKRITYKILPITTHETRAAADCVYAVFSFQDDGSMYVNCAGEGTRLCDAAGNKYKVLGANSSDAVAGVDLLPIGGDALGFILMASSGKPIIAAFEKPPTGTQFVIKGLNIDGVKRDDIAVTLP